MQILLTTLMYLAAISLCFSHSMANATETKSYNEIEKAIKIQCPKCSLVKFKDLDRDLQNHFKEKYPDSHPCFLSGDFNGDGIADYAILLRCEVFQKMNEKFIVLLGTKKGSFQWINIYQWDDVLSLKNIYLCIILPGKIKELDSSKIKILKLPGIEVNLFESASQVFYWDKDKFNFIQTSD